MTRGVHVCIVGPDGSGKTTLAEATEQALTSRGVECRRVKLRPGWVEAAKTVPFDHHHPQKESPRGLARSAGKVCAKAGYFVLRELRSRSDEYSVRIEERGWRDQMVDNRRYRLHANTKSLISALSRIVDTTDLTVILTGDPDEIVARKPELTVVEIQRQQELWMRLGERGRLGTYVCIDTTTLSTEEALSGLTDALGVRLDTGLEG